MPPPVAEWITEAAFAPYGTLIRHNGDVGRHYLDTALADIEDSARPRLWVNRIDAAPPEIALREVERHPFSAQSFLPLSGTVLLMAVCAAGADGLPDADDLKVFLLPPGTGIIYRRGVWHHGMLSPHGPCDVAVIMGEHPDKEDTQWHTLPHPVHVTRDALPRSHG